MSKKSTLKIMIVISTSPKRNHQQVVYHNTGPDGKKVSITQHMPIDPAKPCIKRPFLGKKSVR